MCDCPMHFPICVCQWLHSCTSTRLQLFGDSPHELAVHNLGKFSIIVLCAVGVAPSVFHPVRGTGPQNWEIFKKCLKIAEINYTVAIAQSLRNLTPFLLHAPPFRAICKSAKIGRKNRLKLVKPDNRLRPRFSFHS